MWMGGRNRNIVGFEIVILVLSTIAFAYLIGGAFSGVAAQEDNEYARVHDDLTASGVLSGESDDAKVESVVNNLNQQGDSVVDSSGDLLDNIQHAGGLVDTLRSVVSEFVAPFGGGDVDTDSLTNAVRVSTCPESRDGKICQEYSAQGCEKQCAGRCLEGSRDELPDDSVCKLGTCYDSEEGTCAPRASQEECKDKGGEWFSDPWANVPQCKKGCCIIGDQAFFVTARQCEKRTESLGVELGSANALFAGDIAHEQICLAHVGSEIEGACTFSDGGEGKKGCKRTTQEGCEEIQGDFLEGRLCSNRELNTNCEPRKTTKCAEGFDEVYWFDSCDNRENIYDSSFDDGLIKKKASSCVLASADNPVLNQGMCGNCNRLAGSACGDESSGERVQELNDAPDGNVVCRDLSCYENNVRRDHGESWCAYHSAIGVDSTGIGGIEIPGLDVVQVAAGGKLAGISSRSIDTPGSRHFRRSCIEGEIISESCGVYRDQICVEERIQKDDSREMFSIAGCRVNRWQECLAYNPDSIEARVIGSLGPKAHRALELFIGVKCSSDPDCFVKSVDLASKSADTFKFSQCLPKYPPGFDLSSEEGRKSAEQVCNYASQECTVVYLKTLSGWECKANCDCEKKKFTQQMNDFCTSLGDCGFEVNYLGNLPGGPGYLVTKDKKPDVGMMILSPVYAALLTGYANFVPGKFANAETDKWFASLGKGGNHLLGDNLVQQILGRIGDKGGSDSGEPKLPKSGGERAIKNVVYPLAGVSGALGGASILTAAITRSSLASSITTAGTTVFLPASVVSNAVGADVLGRSSIIAFAGDSYVQLSEIFSTGAAQGTVITEAGVLSQLNTNANAFLTQSGVESMSASGVKVISVPGGISPVSLGSFGAGLAGGAIASAVTGLVLDKLGIARGLGPVGTIALTTAAGVGGSLLATQGFLVLIGKSASILSGSGPLAIIILIVTAIIITILKIIGIGDIKKIKYKFECMPWEPPRGGAQCDQCGKDAMSDGSREFPCSRYSCEALGNCMFIEESEGPKGGICVSEDKSDTKAPRIVSAHSGEEFEIREFSDAGFKVRKKGESGDKECVNQFEKVEYGFELDEYGRCKIGGDALARFEEMADFGGRGILLKDHSATFTAFEDAVAFDIDLGDPGTRKEISLYVKCQDALGKVNENAYVINLCIVRDDYTPPKIVMIEPLTKYLPFGTTIKDLVVYVNEPSELRWSSEDKDFDAMENVFDCEINPEQRLPNGYECKTSVPIDEDEEVIYIRAKDQPALEGTSDEWKRNENQESIKVHVKRTASALSIDSIKPDNEVISIGTDIASVNLEVRVSGGLSESTTCSVDFDGLFDLLPKIENGVHKKTYERFSSGVHTLHVHCSDGAGNSAEKSTTFTIEKDLVAPLITRVYADGGSVYVVTNERAACGFVNNPEQGMTNACGFSFENAQRMERDEEGVLHHALFENDKVYYIRCKDRFDNQRFGECDIVVKEGIE